MNLKNMLTKKTLLITCSIVLLFVVAGITYAILQTRTVTAQNNFAGKAINIGVIENDGSFNLENRDNIVQYNKIKKGEPTSKKVQIKNIDSEQLQTTDVIVRVRLVPCFRYNDDSKYAGELVPIDVTKNIIFDINNKDWRSNTEANEIYYYYLKPLSPNALSEPLFTKVTYTGDVPADTHFELQVLADGISADQALKGEIPWGLNVLNMK